MLLEPGPDNHRSATRWRLGAFARAPITVHQWLGKTNEYATETTIGPVRTTTWELLPGRLA